MSKSAPSLSRRCFLGGAALGATALALGARRASAQAKPTITYWNGLTGADGKIMDELIDQFTRETGIRMEQQRIGWADLYAKLQVAVPAHEGPDLALIHTVEIPHFASDGILEPMADATSSGKGFKGEDYLPSTWQGGLYFGRAAARLHISQPPLSQKIHRLEDEIGARLFRRTNRRVQLTPAGRAFLVEARQTIAFAERAVGAAQRAERGEVGELVIGYVTSATSGPLPDVIRMFRKRLPAVQLKLRNLRSVRQSQALVERRIDVGLVRPHAINLRIAYEALWREPVVVALPSDHPLAHRTVVDIAAIANDLSLIAPAEDTVASHDQVLALCRRAGFTPRVEDAADAQAALALVAAGLRIHPVAAHFRDSGEGASSIARCDHAAC